MGNTSIWDKLKIKIARIESGYLVKDAAKLLEIHEGYLSMIENGQRQPSNKLISRMSGIYKKPTDYFLKTNIVQSA